MTFDPVDLVKNMVTNGEAYILYLVINLANYGGCIHLNFIAVLLTPWNSIAIQMIYFSKCFFLHVDFCLPPTTVLGHTVVTRPTIMFEECVEKTDSVDHETCIIKSTFAASLL